MIHLAIAVICFMTAVKKKVQWPSSLVMEVLVQIVVVGQELSGFLIKAIC